MKWISTVVVEEKAKAFAEKECPIKTEDDYYKDNVDDPYYDYRVERQLIQARLRHAFKAGYSASEGEEAIGFAEWVSEATGMTENHIYIDRNPFGIGGGYYTVEQLYNIYKQSKK